MAESHVDDDVHRRTGGISMWTRDRKGDGAERIGVRACRLTPVAWSIEPEAPAKNLITVVGRHGGQGDEENQQYRLHKLVGLPNGSRLSCFELG